MFISKIRGSLGVNDHIQAKVLNRRGFVVDVHVEQVKSYSRFTVSRDVSYLLAVSILLVENVLLGHLQIIIIVTGRTHVVLRKVSP